MVVCEGGLVGGGLLGRTCGWWTESRLVGVGL